MDEKAVKRANRLAGVTGAKYGGSGFAFSLQLEPRA